MKKKILAWIKIFRFHFYPMTWIAYSMGAAAAPRNPKKLNLEVYWVGYLVLFLSFSAFLVNLPPQFAGLVFGRRTLQFSSLISPFRLINFSCLVIIRRIQAPSPNTGRMLKNSNPLSLPRKRESIID